MEAKKALVRKNFDGSAEFARTVITNIVYFVSGVLVSKGAMLGNLSPFGASFAAAVPKKIFAVGTCRHRAWLYFAYALGQLQVHSCCGCDRRYKVAYKRYKKGEEQRTFCSACCVFFLFLQRVLYSHLSAQARFPRLPTALSRRCLQVRRLIFSAVR